MREWESAREKGFTSEVAVALARVRERDPREARGPVQGYLAHKKQPPPPRNATRA